MKRTDFSFVRATTKGQQLARPLTGPRPLLLLPPRPNSPTPPPDALLIAIALLGQRLYGEPWDGGWGAVGRGRWRLALALAPRPVQPRGRGLWRDATPCEGGDALWHGTRIRDGAARFGVCTNAGHGATTGARPWGRGGWQAGLRGCRGQWAPWARSAGVRRAAAVLRALWAVSEESKARVSAPGKGGRLQAEQLDAQQTGRGRPRRVCSRAQGASKRASEYGRGAGSLAGQARGARSGRGRGVWAWQARLGAAGQEALACNTSHAPGGPGLEMSAPRDARWRKTDRRVLGCRPTGGAELIRFEAASLPQKLMTE